MIKGYWSLWVVGIHVRVPWVLISHQKERDPSRSPMDSKAPYLKSIPYILYQIKDPLSLIL